MASNMKCPLCKNDKKFCLIKKYPFEWKGNTLINHKSQSKYVCEDCGYIDELDVFKEEKAKG